MTTRTRTQLNSDADTYIQDNTVADITPAEVRQRIKDLADSSTFAEDIGVTVQGYDPQLQALAGVTPTVANSMPFFTSTSGASVCTLSDWAKTLIDDATATAARTTLGLAIGTNVQAYDAELASIAGLTSAADRLPYFTGSGTASLATFTTFGRSLVDDTDAPTARTTLGAYGPETPLYGFKNKIINGNFDFWQRGTGGSLASGTRFVADRWRTDSGGVTNSVAQQTFTPGQTTVPGEPRYYHRHTLGGQDTDINSTYYCYFIQKIEDVRTLAGATATVSFWAKASTGTPLIALELSQDFGSGGSPSSTVAVIGSQRFTLSTSWQKFTATIAINSISGKTIGTTDGTHSLILLIWLAAGSSFSTRTGGASYLNATASGSIDIAQVQIEEGSSASTFEKRPAAIEESLCYRYYYTNYNASASEIWSGNVTSGSPYYNRIRFPVAMKVVPTVTSADAGASNMSTTPNVSNVSRWGFYDQRTASATSAAYMRIYYTAEAE